MALTYVNEIPEAAPRTGKWGRVATELRNNPGRIALVETITFTTEEERRKATSKAAGIQQRLRAHGTKASIRTFAQDGEVRIFAQAID